MPRIQVVARTDDMGRLLAFESEAGDVTFPRSAQVERLVGRYRVKHKPAVSRAVASGDSYAAGVQASSAAKSYYGLMKARFGSSFAFSNYGNSGKGMVNYLNGALLDGAGAATLQQFQVLPDDLFMGVWGLNDLRGADSACGPSPANLPQMQAKMQAVATWLMIAEIDKVRAHTIGDAGANPLVTYAGAWNHGGFGGDPTMSYSSADGASASFTTGKGNLLVIWVGVDTGSTNQCTVKVDGTVVGSWSTKAAYDSWSLSCVLVPLENNARHDVVLTQVGAGNLMWKGAACVDTSQDFGASLLYSPPCYLSDSAGAGWSDAGGALNGATAQALGSSGPYVLNNAGSDRFAAAQNEAMNQLFGLGFNVACVPARVGFKPEAHIGADKIHPNDLGYEHLHKPFAGIFNMITGVS